MARQKQTAAANVDFLKQSLAYDKDNSASREETKGNENDSVTALAQALEEKPPVSIEDSDISHKPSDNELEKLVTLEVPTSSTAKDVIVLLTKSSKITQGDSSSVSNPVALHKGKLTSARGELRPGLREAKQNWNHTISGTTIWQLSPPALFGDIYANTTYSSMPQPSVDAMIQLSSANGLPDLLKSNTATSVDDCKSLISRFSTSNTTLSHGSVLQANSSPPVNTSWANTTFLHNYSRYKQQSGLSNINFLHNIESRQIQSADAGSNYHHNLPPDSHHHSTQHSQPGQSGPGNVSFLHNLSPYAYYQSHYGGANQQPFQYDSANVNSLHNLSPHAYYQSHSGRANQHSHQYSSANVNFLHNLPPQTYNPYYDGWESPRHHRSEANTTPLHSILGSSYDNYPRMSLDSHHSLSIEAGREVKVSKPSAEQLPTQNTMHRHIIRYLEYQPLLNKSPGSLRLLQIQDIGTVGSANDIYCNLTEAQPWTYGSPYECLSYVWGTEASKGTSHVYVRTVGKGSRYMELPVSLNLYAALCQLKKTHGMKWLWIDAICIDQANLEERSSQVAMMKDIYTNASGVVIWLGDSDYNLSVAISTITAISTRFQKDTNLTIESIVGPKGLRLSSDNIELLKSYRSIDILGTTLSAAYEFVACVFALPWFRRVWVLQEAFAHTKISVRLGEHTLPWGSIILAALWSSGFTRSFTSISASENRTEGVIHRGYLPELWLGLLHTRRLRGLTILELVSRARDFEASDPRDKVFALLGLANDVDSPQTRATGLRPDYTKSKVEVYAAFAKDLILMSGNLDVLSLVNTFASPAQDQESISWMPDLDVPVATIRGLGFPKKYDASSSTKVKVDVVHQRSHNLNTLTLFGFCFSRVHFVTENIMTFSRDLKVYIGNDTDAVVDLWRTHIQPKNAHVPEIILLESYTELLSATGFAMPTKFPAHPLGKVIPSREVPSVMADFAAYWARLEPDFTSFRKSSQSYLHTKAEVGDADQFGVLAGKACHERKFFFTADGRMGLCPRNTQIGDEVVILYGGSVPYVLRTTNNKQWVFVGECYVDGVMFGDIEKLKKERKIFHLI